MSEKSADKHWRHTLPGVLTSFTGVITAITALLVALKPVWMPEPVPPVLNTDSAVIQDRDGYTNLRSRPDASSDIVTKITRDEVFTVQVAQGNWWRVTTRNGKEGYVHRSRIRLLR